jgi:hypothetical protein
MNAVVSPMSVDQSRAARYARCLTVSKRIEWQIDRDLIRGRTFDLSRKFLPDGLSFVDRLSFLEPAEKRFVSQVQGRTYAYMFGLVERFISAQMLQQTRDHVLGDQNALEGLVRFAGEELKHQELFRRVERMLAEAMPAGYRMTANPNAVAAQVLDRHPWAVLALTCHIELFVQAHYAQSIAPHEDLCPLFKDVFAFHWRDECQHVVLDELEWTHANERIDERERDLAVDDFVALIGAVDEVLKMQCAADTEYIGMNLGRTLNDTRIDHLRATLLAAYRWQYIVSGAQHAHFRRLLAQLTSQAQQARILAAVEPLMKV